MATGVAIAGLVLAIGGTVVNTRDKNRAIADEKEIADLNAANLAAETAEASKRLEKSNKRTAGLLRAHAAGIGFKTGGSTSSRAGDIISENQSDLDWMKTAGRSRLDILRAESSARLRLSQAERSAGAVRGVSSAIGSGASTYKSLGGTF